MKPVSEAFWIPNAEEWRKKHLRYWPWYGRGFVQLTWEDNYKFAEEQLGVALTERPELALDPGIACEIIVTGMREGWFTGKKLSDYIDLKRSGFKQARRIINGTDKAQSIADLAKLYDTALKAEGYN
jgi:predicted chitinase